MREYIPKISVEEIQFVSDVVPAEHCFIVAGDFTVEMLYMAIKILEKQHIYNPMIFMNERSINALMVWGWSTRKSQRKDYLKYRLLCAWWSLFPPFKSDKEYNFLWCSKGEKSCGKLFGRDVYFIPDMPRDKILIYDRDLMNKGYKIVSC